MSVNSVNLSGNLTRDAVVEKTPNGTSILKVGIAVNDRVRNSQSGEWEQYPNFFELVCYGKRADGLVGHLTQGKKVSVHGKLRFNSWQKDGTRKSRIYVIVDEFDFVSNYNPSEELADEDFEIASE